jgi:hypothetical protein
MQSLSSSVSEVLRGLYGADSADCGEKLRFFKK